MKSLVNQYSNLLVGLFISQLFLVIITNSAMAQNAYESSCRIKAKEVATEAYRSCVTDNKKTQIEQLRNDYQQKLKVLKDEYYQEIKKMSGPSSNQGEQTSISPMTPMSPSPAKKTRSSSLTSTTKVVSKSMPDKRRRVRQQLETQPNDEPSVNLRSAPSDDSTMDIPEPIPVEDVPDHNT